MNLALLLLLVILAGVVYSFRLRGPALRRALQYYSCGILLTLAGLGGSFAALDAETSGNNSFFNSMNPYLWPILLMVGILVLVVNAVLIIRERKRGLKDSAP